jgi:hypothetical protein
VRLDVARLNWIAAMIAGGALGAVAVLAWNALAFYPRLMPLDDHRDLSKANNLSDVDLARALMDRVAPTFVASWRDSSAIGTSVSFYTAPLPYGQNLCRLNIVSFPRKIVRGRMVRGDSTFEDDLTLTRAFGVWGENSPAGLTRESACANYRDFKHLVGGDGVAIDRVVSVMRKAIASVKAGRDDFKVSCGDLPDVVIINCKVTKGAVLKLQPSDLQSVEAGTEAAQAWANVALARAGGSDTKPSVEFTKRSAQDLLNKIHSGSC